MLGNIVPFVLLSSKLLNMLDGALSSLKLGKMFLYAINFQWYVALSTNVRKGGNIQEGVEFPFKFIPLNIILSCYLSPSQCFQLQEGMSLKKICIWPIWHFPQSPSKPNISIAIIGFAIQALSSL
jgi:hypothetical protein